MRSAAFFATHPVFTHEEFLAAHGARGKRSARTADSLLRHHAIVGNIQHVRRGLYATVPVGATLGAFLVDPFLLATKLAPDAAVAYHAALQFHGKVPGHQRPALIDQFKSDPTKHVMLMSYGTGSVGLNLQFTNYVFLFDRWWNPAVEDQAINRAHRVGQKHPVTVTRFLSENTIEGRIAEVLEAKRRIFNELLEQNGPPPVLGLTEDEIFGLFDIRARPKKSAHEPAATIPFPGVPRAA